MAWYDNLSAFWKEGPGRQQFIKDKAFPAEQADCKAYGHFPTSWDHNTTCSVCNAPLVITLNDNGENIIQQAQV